MNGYRSDALYKPAQVILLRHAEKPPTGPELNQQGFKRAQLLPTYFQSHPSLNEFGSPAAIIAAKPNRWGGSIRSIQTVIPLAGRFQLQINENFMKNEEHALAAAIFNTPEWHHQTVVICWNREGLPTLAHLLGANAPFFWDKNCFNKFWVIRYRSEFEPLFFELNQESV